MQMILLTQAVAEAHEGEFAADGINCFGYAVTDAGDYFCNPSNADMFPNIPELQGDPRPATPAHPRAALGLPPRCEARG